jgi:hypothetical protein
LLYTEKREEEEEEEEEKKELRAVLYILIRASIHPGRSGLN